MRMIVKIVLTVLVLAVVLSSATIIRNGAPLAQKPGLGTRLLTYLSKNAVATRPDHEWPELRTQTYALSADELLDRVERAVGELGWEIEEDDNDGYNVHAVVSTPWVGFKDDVHIVLKEKPGNETALQVTSRSRLGRADYGANVSHIIALNKTLERLL